MKYDSMFVGSRLMETITSGLYDGNLNCLREYVQNGIDSHATKIEIFFENGTSNLIIRDNGSGMNREDIIHSLGIGVSYKSEESIGWRGVGIWSGVPVCKRIVIVTKKKDNNKYRIEINNDLIRSENLSNKSILDILSEATGEIEELPLGNNDSYESDHFTMVRLESILPTQKYLFNNKQIIDYLSSELPVPFDSDAFPYASEIDGWLNEKGVQFPCVEILFNGNKIYRPPTRSDIYLKCIVKKEFIIKNELIAVGWFLTGLENEKLKMPNCGIYFKKKGFTIGDTNLVLRQFSGMYHPWQYGEIHVTSKNLRENAARNNFEYNTGNVGLFLEEVGDFIKYLEQLNRYKSQKTTPKSIQKLKANVEQSNPSSIIKGIDEIRSRLAYPVSFPKDTSLAPMKISIDEESNREIHVLFEIEQQIRRDKQKDSEKIINIKNEDKSFQQKVKVSSYTNDKISIHQKSENAKKNNDKTKPTTVSEVPRSLSKLALDNLYPKIKDIFSRNLNSDIDYIESDLNYIRDIFKNDTDLDENQLVLYNLFKNSNGDNELSILSENATKEERKLIAFEIIFAADLIHRLLKKS